MVWRRRESYYHGRQGIRQLATLQRCGKTVLLIPKYYITASFDLRHDSLTAPKHTFISLTLILEPRVRSAQQVHPTKHPGLLLIPASSTAASSDHERPPDILPLLWLLCEHERIKNMYSRDVAPPDPSSCSLGGKTRHPLNESNSV
eukprot:scaffold17537_cov180-Skeletonema_marinoi.AAC.2